VIETSEQAEQALRTVARRLRSREMSPTIQGRYLLVSFLRIWWDDGVWVYDAGKGDHVPPTRVPDSEDDLYQAIFSLLRIDREHMRTV
jgi:hypothetical protein